MCEFSAKFVRCSDAAEARDVCQGDPSMLAFRAPAWMAIGSRDAMQTAAQMHQIKLGRNSQRKEGLQCCLRAHMCGLQCTDVVSLFSIVLRTTGRLGGAGGAVARGAFPPKPLAAWQKGAIVRAFTSACKSNKVYESPCAVCGRLTFLSDLGRYEMDCLDLSCLERPGAGVTRKERRTREEPVTEISGPVLLGCAVFVVDGKRFLDICTSCLRPIHKMRIPRHALANGRWIGSIPALLAKLTYVEQMLIAIYRHSFCVAQVTMGQRFLAANVVVFGQPVARAYDVLPPPRQDIEQTLAILFVGPAKPTDTDVRRTPFLLRSTMVRLALEWLSCNNEAYSQVRFSPENLAEYPEDEPPVGIVYHQTRDVASGESSAVYQSRSELGVSKGDCPFVVHCLVGEDLANMTYDEKVTRAVIYFREGGKALAVGHDRDPQSIYHNSALFPGMFPWLYPYGLGGFENSRMLHRLDHASHVRVNLLYADRQFQTDRCFPFIVFNHQQIRASVQGGYLLTRRSNFEAVAQKILTLDRAALDSIIDRSASGEHVVPRTEEEKACFDLIGIIDRVAGHVQGLNTSRKYMRNEIRSLVYAKGVLVFFITFAPVDFKHPLCLYFCGEEIDLSQSAPQIRHSDDRLRAIASNPIGAAHFFDFIVNLFITHILRAGSGEQGLFGTTEAYYGTVESQAWLTLHLHLLLWIKNTLTPQQFRDRLLSDATFEAEVIEWLEDAHTGDYAVSTESSLSSSLEEEYVENRWGEERVRSRIKTGVRDPATELPPSPPAEDASDEAWATWERALLEDVDRVLFFSNRHDKHHSKGCWRVDPGYCRARFPREKFEATMVDRDSGAMRFRKNSQWLNTFNYILTHLLRCNTDVTSLLSGTQIRAVVAYVTDYVTKGKLTTETFFDIIRAVLDKNADSLLDAGVQRTEVARSLIVKVVNAFAASTEIGGPAVGAYLLGNPDHYTDQVFKPFYWYPFVQAAQAPFIEIPSADQRGSEKVLLGCVREGVVEVDKVLHYTRRPLQFEEMCLYDFFTSVDVRKFRRQEIFSDGETSDDGDLSSDSSASNSEAQFSRSERERAIANRFLRGHPYRSTHGAFKRRAKADYIPNFIGAHLPRQDRGDFEEYCKVMLVLFKPGGWRHGFDLKATEEQWSHAFHRTSFQSRHMQIMKNMHVLYECYDARDDYATERRAGLEVGVNDYLGRGQENEGENDVRVADDCAVDYTEDMLSSLLDDSEVGQKTAKLRDEIRSLNLILGGELPPEKVRISETAGASGATVPVRSSAHWKQLVLGAKNRVLESRRRANRVDSDTYTGENRNEENAGEVFVITKEVVDRLFERVAGRVPPSLQDHAILLLDGIVDKFTLNEEQLTAFVIACRHLHHHDRVPLRMLIAGMAGTGKSRVISALICFLEERNEMHRFLVMGPTGASAALIGGSTYHSVLGFTGGREEGCFGNQSIDKVRAKLEDVDLMLVDEFSMISCLALFNIHKKLSSAFVNALSRFGGKSVILAGDPAQLPPPGRSPALYCGKVGACSSSLSENCQKNAFGKALWHTFTTVVILRQNMRQTGATEKDARFRTCLENMRLAQCTPEDVRLLSSRVCRPSAGDVDHLRPEFRDVSIITARNVHRNAINAKKSREYAAREGQSLHRFRAVDSWGRNKESESVRRAQRAFDEIVDPIRSNNVISGRLQAALWDLPPCMSKHHAGTLDLCEGMPVMLKINEATELCATNGAEATVHSWTSHREGERVVLDTLFIKLVNPPREVQLDGLPLNVIPLGRMKRSVKCTLPVCDLTVYASREQPMVLQNFAMTDFGSQGRTRPFNPVHLRFCKNHQSIYTCLSRSSSLDGTLILDGFNTSKICQGASPDLRREFRELEILDHITRLRLKEELPAEIRRDSRQALVQTYMHCMGARFVHDRVPDMLNWSKDSDEDLELSVSGFPPDMFAGDHITGTKSKGKNRLTGNWSKARKKTRANPNVEADASAYDRSLGGSSSAPSGGTLRRRLGYIWDRADFSCAYDALLTLMWNLFEDRGEAWFRAIGTSNPLMGILHEVYPSVSGDAAQLERSRDMIREVLRSSCPSLFSPAPTDGVSVSAIASQLFASSTPFGCIDSRCPCCGQAVSTSADSARCYFWAGECHWWSTRFSTRTYVSAQEYTSEFLSTEHPLVCGRCCSRASAHTLLRCTPPVLLFESATS